MWEQSMAQSSKGEEFWDNCFIEILHSLLSGKDVRFGDKQVKTGEDIAEMCDSLSAARDERW